MANILFRVPELDSLSPESIANKLGQPSIGKVARRDGQPSGKGVPDYLVEPIEFSAQSTHGFREVQLIDFGECKPLIAGQSLLSFSNNVLCSFLYQPPPKKHKHTYLISPAGTGIQIRTNQRGGYLEFGLYRQYTSPCFPMVTEVSDRHMNSLLVVLSLKPTFQTTS